MFYDAVPEFDAIIGGQIVCLSHQNLRSDKPSNHIKPQVARCCNSYTLFTLPIVHWCINIWDLNQPHLHLRMCQRGEELRQGGEWSLKVTIIWGDVQYIYIYMTEGDYYLGGCLVYISMVIIIMVIISMKYGYNLHLLIVQYTLW